MRIPTSKRKGKPANWEIIKFYFSIQKYTIVKNKSGTVVELINYLLTKEVVFLLK